MQLATNAARPWMARTLYDLRARQLNVAAIHVFLISDILFSSRLYRAFLPGFSQRVILAVLLVILFGYAFVAFLRLQLSVVAAFVGVCGLTVLQMFVFEHLTAAQFNLNSAFQYSLLTSFVVFAMLKRSALIEYALRWFLIFSVLYSVLYVFLSINSYFNLVPALSSQELLLFDDGRGVRLYNYSAATAFAWFYALHAWRRSPTALLPLLLVAACGLALAMTLSRIYIACVLAVTALYLVGWSRRTIAATILAVLFSVSFVHLYGLVDPSFNPFTSLSGDASGSARASEYETARHFIWANPLTGVGIAPAPEDVGFLTGNYHFAGGDLGIIGIWWDYGLVGVVLFFLCSCLAVRTTPQLRPDLDTPLFLTGGLIVLYGIIAPVIFNPGGVTVFGMILGCSLVAAPEGRGRPGTAPSRPGASA